MNSKKHPHGFTLVELLVTITIVVTLAGIVFVLSKTAIDRAQQAVCTTNLGYVGQAIQAYAFEHGNRLPGPLYSGQSAIVGPPRNLATFIAEYMEVPGEPVNGKVVIASFACPAWRKQLKTSNPEDSICYQVWGNLKLTNGRTVNPWTYPKPWGTPQPEPPARLDEFDPIAAGRTIALIEQDALLSSAWGGSSGPATPPHGNKRTALYFDWSVRTVPVPSR
jgi:prepilin-type N-terminal cleavage/methylation domain-containing protein/prepilin-type processing-associated H-X9-DG protein